LKKVPNLRVKKEENLLSIQLKGLIGCFCHFRPYKEKNYNYEKI